MAEIKEECGVFGIYDLDGNDVTSSIYYGLTSLQHRGQEACGLAVSDTRGPIGNVKFHKDLGLVSEVLRADWNRTRSLFHNRSIRCRECTASGFVLYKGKPGTGT